MRLAVVGVADRAQLQTERPSTVIRQNVSNDWQGCVGWMMNKSAPAKE